MPALSYNRMVFTTQTQRLAPHSAHLHNVVFVKDAVSPRHTESLRPFLKTHDKGSSAGRLIREELNKLKLQRAAEIGIPRDALFPWELANDAGVKHQATSRARAGGVGHLYHGPTRVACFATAASKLSCSYSAEVVTPHPHVQPP